MTGPTLRRSVIFGGTAALGVAALSTYGLCRRRDDAALRLERLDVALGDIRFPDRLAAAYRHGRTRGDLIAELSRDAAVLDAMAIACPATRRAAFRTLAQRQFRAGRTCVAGRMVVSESERLIAALRHRRA